MKRKKRGSRRKLSASLFVVIAVTDAESGRCCAPRGAVRGEPEGVALVAAVVLLRGETLVSLEDVARDAVVVLFPVGVAFPAWIESGLRGAAVAAFQVGRRGDFRSEPQDDSEMASLQAALPGG